MLDCADAETFSRQLGNAKTFVSGVAARCPHGLPTVALLSPLTKNGAVNFTALSTPLWLTCPFLNKKIHGLESSGYIKKIKLMFESDTVFKTNARRDREAYDELKMAVYRVFFSSRRGADVLTKISRDGASAASGAKGLQCLHRAAAHYAACRENAVGALTFELLGEETYCPAGECLGA